MDRSWLYAGSTMEHDSLDLYPPTPAFTKAGAAPGTTAGVEPVFAGVPLPCRSPAPTMPKTLRGGSFDQALRPLPSGHKHLLSEP